MISKRQIVFLLPLGIAAIGVILLARISIIDPIVLLPEDRDILIILIILSFATVASIYLIVRISMEYLRALSVKQARREALAEHRRFLNRLDHEFKNPLTALHAGLRTLELTLTDEEQRRMIEMMETETLRLSRLIADLRKLTELETQPLDVQAIDMPQFFQLCAEAVELERERIEADGKQLLLELPPLPDTSLRFYGDPDLLLLAIDNLLDNAAKYTRPGDSVRLRVALEDEYLIVEVIDTGIGIPPDALPRVWEELYRADPTGKIPGKGIGLSLVKIIIERHYGDVNIKSQPEIGSTVRLSIPLP